MSGPECRRLAKLARKRSDLAAARELAETALNLDRATGDEAGVSEDAALLAGLYMACGEAGLAEVAAVEALRCNGTTASAICAAGVLGLVYVRQEDYARGEQMFLNALRAALQSGRSDLQATMYANLATLNAARGNFETASERLAQAIAIFETLQMTADLEKARGLSAILQNRLQEQGA